MVRRHHVREHTRLAKVRSLNNKIKYPVKVRAHVRGDADPREVRVDSQGYPRLTPEGVEHHALMLTDDMRALAHDGYTDKQIIEWAEEQVEKLDIGSPNRNSIMSYLRDMVRDQPTDKQWSKFIDENVLLYMGRSDDLDRDRDRAENALLDAPWEWIPADKLKQANEALDTAYDDVLADQEEFDE